MARVVVDVVCSDPPYGAVLGIEGVEERPHDVLHHVFPQQTLSRNWNCPEEDEICRENPANRLSQSDGEPDVPAAVGRQHVRWRNDLRVFGSRDGGVLMILARTAHTFHF